MDANYFRGFSPIRPGCNTYEIRINKLFSRKCQIIKIWKCPIKHSNKKRHFRYFNGDFHSARRGITNSSFELKPEECFWLVRWMSTDVSSILLLGFLYQFLIHHAPIPGFTCVKTNKQTKRTWGKARRRNGSATITNCNIAWEKIK